MSSTFFHPNELAETQQYNERHLMWRSQMPREKNKNGTSFGARLAALRKAAGYTQEELAEELGVSRRIITYYEGESDYPPAALLPQLAKAFDMTVDELLGADAVKKTAARPGNTRLQRRLQQLEKLGAREKRQVLQLLDTFIERERWKKKAEGAGT
jgi:transcriptional regulator with XRE-family HTH domain